MRRIAVPLLLVALVGGTSAAFAITQSLKDERSPVGVPRFRPRVIAPTCDCRTDSARLRLRLREADRVTARIVDSSGAAVRTLADGKPYERGRLTLVWNGRTATGRVAPEGAYRLEVHLARQGRTMLLPTTIHVDTTRPAVRILDVRPRIFAQGPKGKRRIGVRYRSSERARPILTVSGNGGRRAVVARGRFWPAGKAKVLWSGRIRGKPAPPGRYRLVLRVRDRAGNESAPASASLRVEKAGG